MSNTSVETEDGWFEPDELAAVRRRMPILYVDVIPVRVDPDGVIQRVGMLLRTPRDGGISRALVSGRVMFHELIRDALSRHIDKDLGPMALPRIPVTLTPFTVAEYFPTPGITPYHDPRQHAVSLAYIVPVDGDCSPQQDALDIGWFTPEEAVSPMVQADMVDGHGALVRTALATVGRLV
ncbi:NUDIX hydrolase family protein [Ruania halotolerans]|uniref:NUDIX hydrolase family protein n=1 Tax=Ruania halotolerans TaxID=2897773 RepID=UPI0020977B4C|nr:NUDIX hydrolase family protein [Ruania halotolerans]